MIISKIILTSTFLLSLEVELGSPGCSRSVTDSCMSPDATCQSNGYCTCNSGYYDNNGNTAGGTCTRSMVYFNHYLIISFTVDEKRFNIGYYDS